MLHAPLPPSNRQGTLLLGVSSHATAYHEPPTYCLSPAASGVLLEETVDRIEYCLRAAVADACAGTVPAVLATGGLDSAVIAALVRDVTGTPPTLVSAGAGLLSSVELRLLDDLAGTLGSPQLRLGAVPAFDVEPLLRLNRRADLPRGGVFSHVWDALADLAGAAGETVLLTGVGGDELFSSGFPHALDLLVRGHLTAGLAVLGRTRPSDGSGTFRHVLEQHRSGCLPSKAYGPNEYLLNHWRGAHAGDAAGAHRRRRAQFAAAAREAGSAAGAEIAVRMERLDLTAATDSRGNVRVEHPMLASKALRAAVVGAPPAHRSFAGPGALDKTLLRLVGRRYLPAALTETRKTGTINQIAVLLAHGPIPIPTRRLLATAGKWLGLDLDDRFWTPNRLPAEVGVDWTNMLAMSAWATNAL